MLGFLGQFMMEDEPKAREKPPSEKSIDTEEFLKSREAKEFVQKWSSKTKDNKPAYTKRGVTALLSAIFKIPGLTSNKEVLKSANELLSMLGGMDGLTGFLMGWKAKSEGIIKKLFN